MRIFVTNNPLFNQKYRDVYNVKYCESSYRDVFITARDMIHKNYKLETHPLAGNLKPNETPYKTLLLTHNDKESVFDFNSLYLIEQAITVCDKYPDIKTDISQSIKDDFMFIDLSIMEAAINGIQLKFEGGI